MTDIDDEAGKGNAALALKDQLDNAPAPGSQYEYLDRDAIAQADDYEERDVLVPEWTKNGKPGKVRVKRLTGTERDRFEGSIVATDKKGNRQITTEQMRAKLVVMAVVHPPGTDKAGERVFSDGDVSWLSEKAAAAVDRIFGVAQELAGLSDEDMDDLKAKLGEAPAASTSA